MESIRAPAIIDNTRASFRSFPHRSRNTKRSICGFTDNMTMSAFPAEFLRLYDRGYIQTGKAAYIVVFDAATVRDNSTWSKPNEFSSGVRYVVVSGQLALKNGTPTGATPGRFIQRQARSGS